MPIKLQGTNSAAAPGLTNDGGDGIVVGTDSVDISTGGTSRLKVDSSGRLLLGTTTEGAADADDFTIATSTNSAGLTIRTSTSGTGRLWFSDGTSGAAEYQGYVQYDHNNSRLELGSNADTRITVDSSGHVNIGCNTSANPLSYLRFGATQLGAADIRPVDDGSHKVGLAFYVDGNTSSIDPAEKVRITSAGHLLVGRTDTTVDSSNFGNDIGNGGIYCSRNVTGASTCFGGFGSQGAAYIMGDGDLLNTNNSYGPISSDERLKENIADVTSQWEDVKNIVLKKFTYKNSKTGTVQIGPIAQELQKVCPNLIKTKKATKEDIENSDGLIKEGDDVLTYKSSIMQLKGFKALQEAMAKIEVLETKVAALESS